LGTPPWRRPGVGSTWPPNHAAAPTGRRTIPTRSRL